jgi:hypothetical protein
MNALVMTLLAMMLSTASATRTLKEHSCDSDYQPPNYWGKCMSGLYQNLDVDSNARELKCEGLVILVPHELVGDKTLAIQTWVNNGYIARDLFLSEYGYYMVSFHQDGTHGPDVDIKFYLDGKFVHGGHYQQNYCFMKAGAITADDPSAESYEGSYGEDISGHIIIKSFN